MSVARNLYDDFDMDSLLSDKTDIREAMFDSVVFGYPDIIDGESESYQTLSVSSLIEQLEQTSLFKFNVTVGHKHDNVTEFSRDTIYNNSEGTTNVISLPSSAISLLEGADLMKSKVINTRSPLNFILENIYSVGKFSMLFFALLSISLMITNYPGFTLAGKVIALIFSSILYGVFVYEEKKWGQHSC